MYEPFSRTAVVVAIDGSQAAIRAARWAVNEVAGTDAPLRLLYCSEVSPGAGYSAGRDLSAAAEETIHDVRAAVDALGHAVKVEVEVVEGLPIPALIDATEHARLLCIGNAESGNCCSSGFGSTAATLVQSAICPVAVVRSDTEVNASDDRSIVALVDGSPNDEAALTWGFAEADRRNAPLVLMTAYPTEFDLLQKDCVLREHERAMQAVLDTYATARASSYPRVHISTITAFSTFLNYLRDHAASIQLAIVGAHRTVEVCQLVGSSGAVTLSGSDFSLLVVR